MNQFDFSAEITIKYLGHEFTRKVPEGIEDTETFLEAIEDLLTALYRVKHKGVEFKIVEGYSDD